LLVDKSAKFKQAIHSMPRGFNGLDRKTLSRSIQATSELSDIMREKVGELFQDDYPVLTIIQASTARWDFTAARDDAITLLSIHDQATGRKSGRPKPKLEALKRSALILAVTAWESFIEDTVVEQLDLLLTRASDPAAVSSIFNGVADEWLDSKRSGPKRPPDLIQWTGDKWKDAIRQSLKTALDSFHTPNSENTAKLFKRYLGVDVVKNWTWQAVSPDKAQKQLDALIKLRGRIVHRGRTMLQSSTQQQNVDRRTVVKALNLIYNLVDATERALGVGPEVRPLKKED